MTSIENIFSDNEGNHLLVALDFYDDYYKQHVLNIPEEYCDIDIVDINIIKAFTEKPIHPAVFLKMSTWLLQQYEIHNNAIFSFICSTENLSNCNLRGMSPQFWRWTLFDRLFSRIEFKNDLNYKNIFIGTTECNPKGRVFHRIKHAPIIHVLCSHLKDIKK